MQRYGKFKQTQGACIVQEPPIREGVGEEESKGDVVMSNGAASLAEESKDELQYKDKEITVLYFGAGRGPLIRRALSAAKATQANVKVIALDKNPNAIVTLRNMIIDENL